MDDVVVSPTKEVGVQTAYRESEAQTIPYAPNYIVPAGQNPRILLMAGLTCGNGLPIGEKGALMVEYAMQKRELELNMPPFTDEASLTLRKKLMEQQEMREQKMRENEIDAQREFRMEQLEQALIAREETAEFATAQRVENLREKLLAERERKLQQVRNKRIKVLRRLAQARSQVDPLLSDSHKRDIIQDYFDKGSSIYAPRVRDGASFKIDPAQLDVASRTATLLNVANVVDLESSLPLDMSFTATNLSVSQQSGVNTAPTSAAEHRMTSAAMRAQRNAKKDVDMMSRVLSQNKKKSIFAGSDLSRPATTLVMPDASTTTDKKTTAALSQSRVKPRPPTPDLTRNRDEDAVEEAEQYEAAVILLQRLLRGRAAQNTAYEGRFRRSELITELREASAELAEAPDIIEEEEFSQRFRRNRVLDSGVNAAIGGIMSSVLGTFVAEHVRPSLL
jgi:hypothetical protein